MPPSEVSSEILGRENQGLPIGLSGSDPLHVFRSLS
jgi:hypothetical protein